MINALATDRPDQAFKMSVLTGCAERRGPVSDPGRPDARFERDAGKCSIIVENEIFQCAISRNAAVICRARHSAVGLRGRGRATARDRSRPRSPRDRTIGLRERSAHRARAADGEAGAGKRMAAASRSENALSFLTPTRWSTTPTRL